MNFESTINNSNKYLYPSISSNMFTTITMATGGSGANTSNSSNTSNSNTNNNSNNKEKKENISYNFFDIESYNNNNNNENNNNNNNNNENNIIQNNSNNSNNNNNPNINNPNNNNNNSNNSNNNNIPIIHTYNHHLTEEKIKLKLFLFRLLSALHSSGNLSYRTEKYVHRVGKKYGINATATVFTNRAILTFQDSHTILNPSFSESYTYTISSGWMYGNLIELDQLCFNILQRDLSFDDADICLKHIESNPWSYPWYSSLLAFGLSSFCATTLFFGGTWIDGGWAFVFGCIAYILDVLSNKLTGLSEISCFVTSFIIAIIATILDKYFYNGSLCLFGQLFGGVVWLLPGITITIGLLEIYSKMPMYGSARLVYGISLASQLGFGLTLGYMLASNSQQIPDSFINGCREPISIYYGFILLPIMATSFAIMISSAYRQIPGMILTCGVGVVTSHIALYYGAGVAAIPFIASMTVTIIGRIYAYLDGNQRPFTYIITGLLVLVPGGVGVRGMSDMWSGNSQTGIEFTFRMLMVAVSLAMGMFIALIPSQKWFMIKVKTQSNSTKLFGNDIQLTIINPLGSKEYRSHRLDSIESC